ncbi:MAG TPA: hypothetical protein VGE98_10285 [Thermoanaerobaculia bacterium]
MSDEADPGKWLTHEGRLDALLARLDDDRERAAERYLELHRQLVRLFEWRRLEPADELADETLNRAGRRFAEGVELRSEEPFPYLRGIAFLIFKEEVRRRAREQAALQDGPWPPGGRAAPVDDTDEERRLDCLDLCLSELPEEQRRLLLRYHADGDRIRIRRKLSRELDLPLNALRIRVHRLRRKLEVCLRSCLDHP